MNNNLFSLLVKCFKFTRRLRFVLKMIVVCKFNISCELCALIIIFIYYLSIIYHYNVLL